MLKENAKIGMLVVFGRPGERAEKTKGKIIKVNPKMALVETLEDRGNGRGAAPGAPWKVPYSLMEPLPASGDKDEVEIKGRAGMIPNTPIIPGVTTFRYHYADGNPLWKVVRSSGRNVYLCVVIAEQGEFEGDWVGTQKHFGTHEIVASIGLENMFKGIHDEGEAFYASLKPGQVVHYNNGFSNYVRCHVVAEKGKNVLKPFALVGEWREHDLPSRRRNGEIYLPYYVQKIVEGETFEPNASNVYEHKHQDKDKDPTRMTPINLECAPMNEVDAARAKLWKKIEQIHEESNSRIDDPKVILATIQKIINED